MTQGFYHGSLVRSRTIMRTDRKSRLRGKKTPAKWIDSATRREWVIESICCLGPPPNGRPSQSQCTATLRGIVLLSHTDSPSHLAQTEIMGLEYQEELHLSISKISGYAVHEGTLLSNWFKDYDLCLPWRGNYDYLVLGTHLIAAHLVNQEGKENRNLD